MKAYLVDTNVLLDLIGADPQFGPSSKACLARCAQKGTLVINPLIYAEVGALVGKIEELDELLPQSLFRREDLPWEAGFIAGQSLRRYRTRGGRRKRVLADFLIGAHAAVNGMTLISRDQGYAKYFQITILDPSKMSP